MPQGRHQRCSAALFLRVFVILVWLVGPKCSVRCIDSSPVHVAKWMGSPSAARSPALVDVPTALQVHAIVFSDRPWRPFNALTGGLRRAGWKRGGLAARFDACALHLRLCSSRGKQHRGRRCTGLPQHDGGRAASCSRWQTAGRATDERQFCCCTQSSASALAHLRTRAEAGGSRAPGTACGMGKSRGCCGSEG